MSTDKAEQFAAMWSLLAPPDVLPPEREFRFHPSRKWRFDFAWPSRFVAVEIEGNAWGVKGGGRHMQDGDMEKYNAAAVLSWRVLRFSPGMLKRDPAGCIDAVLRAMGELP